MGEPRHTGAVAVAAVDQQTFRVGVCEHARRDFVGPCTGRVDEYRRGEISSSRDQMPDAIPFFDLIDLGITDQGSAARAQATKIAL